MITPVLTMALLMGLTGSLHCAGMCGPIIWVMPFQFISGFKKWMGIGLYHFGRITVYALLVLTLHIRYCSFVGGHSFFPIKSAAKDKDALV